MTATAISSGLERAEILGRAAALADDFATRAADHDRDATFPFENFGALRDAGLLSLTIPEEFGGLGEGLEVASRTVELIARGDASTALVLSMQYIFHAGFARRRTWPATIYERICRESVGGESAAGLERKQVGEEHAPGYADGVALVNALRVEPELGTPSRGGLPATTATRVTDGWRLDGHKIYATGSPILRYYLVFARTAGDAPEVGIFLVPRDTPGLRIVRTWDHMGMRATGSDDVIFEDARIPREYAVDVRPPAAWSPPDPGAGIWNGVVLAALYHGVARAARDWLVRYLNERTPANLGASLATLSRFQSAVGEIEALLYASDQLIFGYAARVDAGAPAAATEPSLVKYVATNNAVRAVDIAISLVGNPGLSRHHPLERHHRDVLCSRIHSPQDDMITLAAGKAALGVS